MSTATGGSRPGASTLRTVGCLAALIATLAMPWGCGAGGRLQPTFDSPTAAAQAVVDALSQGDVATLERLALDEHEFRRIVWPRQPAARPGRNLPWDYVWRDLAGKSRAQLRGRLAEWPRGRPLTVVDVAFDGDTTDYDTYRVMRKSRITLGAADGTRMTVRLFGSLIEQHGRFKIFSYVTD